MFTGKSLRLATLILVLCTSTATAQQRPDESSVSQGGILDLIPTNVTTQHVLVTGAGHHGYAATAGTVDLHQGNGRLGAKVFYTAYVLNDRAHDRPITFAFNGGPGAASAYLHMGMAGPRIVEFGAKDRYGAMPELRDNPVSWLEFTDLVFIDPVGTGWSRAVSEDVARFYYGVEQDAESLARAIAILVSEQKRLSAPKFLLGESYGAFRAAKVATALRERQGIVLSGIVMVSPFLEGRHLASTSDDPLSAALQLPSLAAAELERAGAFGLDALAAAERFAMTEYLTALADPPLPASAARFYARVSDMTGIPERDVARVRGYVGALYATRSTTAAEAVSPYDASFTYPNPYPAADGSRGADPVLDGHTRAYGSAFASYAREELNFDARMTYVLLSDGVNRRWDWGGPRFLASAVGDLADMLAVNRQFRVMILHGYSDALTPYRASEYIVDQLPPELTADKVLLTNYRGGHMFYTNPSSRRAAAETAARFFRDIGT